MALLGRYACSISIVETWKGIAIFTIISLHTVVRHDIGRDGPPKNGGHKSANDTLERSTLDYSKASMSHIRHYRALPWATGLLTLLESIAKAPHQQVTKTGKSSIC